MIEALSVLVEVSDLAPLAEWQPVGARLEALVDASRGQGPVTARDLREIRSLAARWRRLPPALRDFYLRHLDRDCARAALWHVLVARRVPGPLYGRVKRLWRQDRGVDPCLDLCPVR